MRLGSLLVTLFGVAIAGASVFLAKEYVMDTRGAANASTTAEMVEVIVVRSDIEFGQAIEPHLLSSQTWPVESMPTGAFTDLADLLPPVGVDPRRAKAKLYKGEIVLAAKLSAFGEKVTIVQKLGENTRAMAIKVDAVTAVGGFVTPGDYVDIVMTQGSNDNLRSVTILQNIRVIGVDQQSEESTDQPEIARTMTVEVTPDQGQRLALAQKAGTLSLTLRTLDGVIDQPLDMVQLRDLLQEKSPVLEAEKKPTITIRRGNTVEIVEIK